MRYTPAQRDEAVNLAADAGLSEASRRLQISKGSLSRWCAEAGVELFQPKRVQVAALRWEERRLDLAHEAGRVAAKALAATESYLAESRPREAQQAATTMAILADKAQLLTGAATSRSEHSVSPERAVELRDKVRHLKVA